MNSTTDANEIVESFRQILTFQTNIDNTKSFILPRHPGTDNNLFIEAAKLKDDSIFASSIYRIYIRRQYYYSREVWEAISLIDEVNTHIDSNLPIQKLNISKSLKRFIDECEENYEEIGLNVPQDKKERELVKKRNFGALSEVTIDIIAHAVLSKYNKFKYDSELNNIFPKYIYKILNNEIVVDDPCNKFWALRYWLIDLPKEAEEHADETDRFLRDCIEGIRGHYFESPPAKGWDSTPEIYTNERTTMYSLINILYIKKHLMETKNANDKIFCKINNCISDCAAFIESSKGEIFKNPYLISLYIRYRLV